jgi:hypothetical protein
VGRRRWLLFLLGALVGAVLTYFVSKGMFISSD